MGENHTCSRYGTQLQRYSHAAAATTNERTWIGRRARLRWIRVLLLILLLLLLLRRGMIVQEREGEYQTYRLDLFLLFVPTEDRVVRLLRAIG